MDEIALDDVIDAAYIWLCERQQDYSANHDVWNMRWKLRKAIQVVNQILAELKVEQHPDKTFIGRIDRGFDFSGYRFSSAGLGIAPQTIERFKARMARLYEQGADEVRIGQYARRWWC